MSEAPPPCAGTICYDTDDLTLDDLFGYIPNLGLASAALAIFLLYALVIGFLTERRKDHRFVHCVTATCLMEAAAYIALVWAIKNNGKTSIFNAYVVMQVFVIEAPNILQAALYMTICRVLFFSPELSKTSKWLRGWVVTTIFAVADVLAISIQASGISIWASNKSSGEPDTDVIRVGCAITLAGLVIQLVFFIAFTVLAIWVQRHPKMGLHDRPAQTKKLFLGFYLAMVGLYIRNIFRVVQYTQNTILDWPVRNPDIFVVQENEALFYSLDCLPIVLAVGVYVFIHPGYLLPPFSSVKRESSPSSFITDNGAECKV